ncbi:hypothetical protein PybrP1_003145 [[Pythium] brassicae (nom. inval.)]|nr:hypothetical protein PybrP1_003145 [[Pythium] brassicae (nom. inval.)]
MLSAWRLRAVVCAAAVAAAAASNAYNPQFIVLGRNGQVLDHVDPSLFLHARVKQSSAPLAPTAPVESISPLAEHQAPQAPEHERVDAVVANRESRVVSSQLSIVQINSEAEEQSAASRDAPNANAVEVEITEVVGVRSESPLTIELGADRLTLDAQRELYHEIQQEIEYDEFLQLESSLLDLESDSQQAVEVPEVATEHANLFDGSFPGVPGSILFSEMRWCLVVAFGAAILYQVAAVSWYFDLVSPEVMIGLSSLITRMISLGMVPITTTSFVGRAREACSEQQQLLQQQLQQQQQSQQQAATSSSGSGRSSRRHPRARAS